MRSHDLSDPVATDESREEPGREVAGEALMDAHLCPDDSGSPTPGQPAVEIQKVVRRDAHGLTAVQDDQRVARAPVHLPSVQIRGIELLPLPYPEPDAWPLPSTVAEEVDDLE